MSAKDPYGGIFLNASDLEKSMGVELQTVFPGYSLYKAGVGVWKEYRLDTRPESRTILDPWNSVHLPVRTGLIRKLCEMVIQHLFHKELITEEERRQLHQLCKRA